MWGMRHTIQYIYKINKRTQFKKYAMDSKFKINKEITSKTRK